MQSPPEHDTEPVVTVLLWSPMNRPVNFHLRRKQDTGDAHPPAGHSMSSGFLGTAGVGGGRGGGFLHVSLEQHFSCLSRLQRVKLPSDSGTEAVSWRPLDV